MSFSSEVKEELSKIENLANKETVKQELIGYLLSSNIVINNGKIKFSTESEYNINRFAKLLNNTQIIDYKIEIQDKTYIITIKEKELLEQLSQVLEIKEINIELKDFQIFITNASTNNKQQDIPLKAIARGIFLGAGAINNPERTYHLDIGLSQEKNAIKIVEQLELNGINLKLIQKNNSYHIYTKDGEEISKFLAFIGANKAVLEFENIRVEREMRNKINRMVNCESANLNKTMNASIEQIEAINKLQKSGKLKKLDDDLKEIAEIRLKNPNASLIEIGKMLKNPVGKSGVNYRLKKIVELAKNI